MHGTQRIRNTHGTLGCPTAAVAAPQRARRSVRRPGGQTDRALLHRSAHSGLYLGPGTFRLSTEGRTDPAMPADSNRRWLFVARPKGPGSPDNFEWAHSEVPSPASGQMLVRNLWLSFDPTQVLSMLATPEEGGLPLGSPMRGLAVSEVVESRHPSFQPGDLVYGQSAWEDFSVIDGKGYWDSMKVPPGISPRLAAGTLGITGIVAYFGVLEVARPRPGETFVVAAAVGGVGSIAAQVAKIRGLRVIGIAGGKEKCDWLVKEAGIDGAIDHRTENVAARLDALCPDGIDIYFDNVGGSVLDLALDRLRVHG